MPRPKIISRIPRMDPETMNLAKLALFDNTTKRTSLDYSPTYGSMAPPTFDQIANAMKVGTPVVRTGSRFTPIPEGYKFEPGVYGQESTREVDPSPSARFANLPEFLGGGSYAQDSEQKGKLIKSTRVRDDDQTAFIRGGLSSKLFQVDHILPIWAGGQDAPQNKQVLSNGEHRKKTQVGAVARTLYYNKDIGLNEAKTLAVTWRERGAEDVNINEDSGEIIPTKGKSSVEIAKEQYKLWQKPKKVGIKEWFAALQEGPKGAVGEFAQSFAGGIPGVGMAFKGRPIEEYEKDEQLKIKAARVAGGTLGMLTGFGVLNRVLKGIQGFTKLKSLSDYMQVKKGAKIFSVGSKFGKAGKLGKHGLSPKMLTGTQETLAKMINTSGLFGLHGITTMKEEKTFENIIKDFASSAVLGSTVGVVGGRQTLLAYGGLGIVSFSLAKMLDASDEDALISALVLIGLHGAGGVGRYKANKYGVKVPVKSDKWYKPLKSFSPDKYQKLLEDSISGKELPSGITAENVRGALNINTSENYRKLMEAGNKEAWRIIQGEGIDKGLNVAGERVGQKYPAKKFTNEEIGVLRDRVTKKVTERLAEEDADVISIIKEAATELEQIIIATNHLGKQTLPKEAGIMKDIQDVYSVFKNVKQAKGKKSEKVARPSEDAPAEAIEYINTNREDIKAGRRPEGAEEVVVQDVENLTGNMQGTGTGKVKFSAGEGVKRFSIALESGTAEPIVYGVTKENLKAFIEADNKTITQKQIDRLEREINTSPEKTLQLLGDINGELVHLGHVPTEGRVHRLKNNQLASTRKTNESIEMDGNKVDKLREPDPKLHNVSLYDGMKKNNVPVLEMNVFSAKERGYKSKQPYLFTEITKENWQNSIARGRNIETQSVDVAPINKAIADKGNMDVTPSKAIENMTTAEELIIRVSREGTKNTLRKFEEDFGSGVTPERAITVLQKRLGDVSGIPEITDMLRSAKEVTVSDVKKFTEILEKNGKLNNYGDQVYRDFALAVADGDFMMIVWPTIKDVSLGKIKSGEIKQEIKLETPKTEKVVAEKAQRVIEQVKTKNKSVPDGKLRFSEIMKDFKSASKKGKAADYEKLFKAIDESATVPKISKTKPGKVTKARHPLQSYLEDARVQISEIKLLEYADKTQYDQNVGRIISDINNRISDSKVNIGSKELKALEGDIRGQSEAMYYDRVKEVGTIYKEINIIKEKIKNLDKKEGDFEEKKDTLEKKLEPLEEELQEPKWEKAKFEKSKKRDFSKEEKNRKAIMDLLGKKEIKQTRNSLALGIDKTIKSLPAKSGRRIAWETMKKSLDGMSNAKINKKFYKWDSLKFEKDLKPQDSKPSRLVEKITGDVMERQPVEVMKWKEIISKGDLNSEKLPTEIKDWLKDYSKTKQWYDKEIPNMGTTSKLYKKMLEVAKKNDPGLYERETLGPEAKNIEGGREDMRGTTLDELDKIRVGNFDQIFLALKDTGIKKGLPKSTYERIGEDLAFKVSKALGKIPLKKY